MTNETARADDADDNQPVFGIEDNDELKELLGGITANPEELDTSGLDDCDVTIVGFQMQKGGDTRTNDDDEEYITSDQIVMHCRVENIDGIDFTRQWFPLPKRKADGTMKQMAAGSRYGIWLSVLSELGVSGDSKQGHRFHFQTLPDLIGLNFHRVNEEYEGFRGRSTFVQVPVELYGFDNEIRSEAGLEPAELAVDSTVSED